MKWVKLAIKAAAIFTISIVGGIFANQVLWPHLVERPLSPVYVTEKKEITTYVQENIALRDAIGKVSKAVVGVRTKTKEGELLEGSGLVVTADGFIVTLADLVPQGSDFAFYVDGEWPAYQILKRDLKNNLALIKIEDGGLPTAGFADLGKIKLGERVFPAGLEFIENATDTKSILIPSPVVDEGIIAAIGQDFIKTNIFDGKLLSGSPLFTIEGKAIGLSIIGEDGRLSVIPVTQIRSFLGF